VEDPFDVHRRFSPARAQAYEDLFGGAPSAVFPATRFGSLNVSPLIDVFVYPLEVEGEAGPIVVAVTNGMSDRRMTDPLRPAIPPRRELIQYFRVCDEGFARRLHDAAWLPHADGFAVDVYDTIAWPDAPEGEFRDSFFLRPIWDPHAALRVPIESDNMSLLWHIPLTDAELAYKRVHGAEALIDRMEEVDLPWVFDPNNRPPLVPASP
jgi:hypothetical protein